MKNQYFGDINDFKKYGLLRAIWAASGLRLGVAWMLTPDDGSTDGKFIRYLDQPSQWEHYDPDLFNALKGFLNSGYKRGVGLFERSDLLENAGYFSNEVSDGAEARKTWFDSLEKFASYYDLIFLDPDNGLEVKSRPYGSRNSSKFLYWREVEALWKSGKSLLIYQHFIREKRIQYIQRMRQALLEHTPGSIVEAFSTKHVVFLMALQPPHQSHHSKIIDSVLKNWKDQISIAD